ncbi:MAG: hypothetical protein AAGF11_33905 [Myxococcota bacterium]
MQGSLGSSGRVAVCWVWLGGVGLVLGACGDVGSSPDAGPGLSPLTLGGQSSGVDGEADTDEPFGGDTEIDYLYISPAEALLEIDLGVPTTQAYTVTAVLEDGGSMDVTDAVTWSISDPQVGAMTGATLEVPGFDASTFTSAILTAELDGERGQAQVTIAAYRLAEDFFFVLPYEDGEGEQTRPLTFSTGVKSMDVFVNMDTTGSMGGALSNLQSAMASTIIPGIQALVPDTQFGGGTFEDFPLSNYGQAPSDQPFELFQEITGDVAAVQDAVLGFSLGNGADVPEANLEALYQIATGAGIPNLPPTVVPPNASGIGGVGFREGSLPVVVSITDAVSHDAVHNECGQAYSGAVAAVAHSREQTLEALNGICARVVQIALGGGTCSALADGVMLAEGTDAQIPPEAWDIGGRPSGCQPGQCCTGYAGNGTAPNSEGLCPMAYLAQSNGTGVDTSFSSAIQMLAAYGRFGVTSLTTGASADTEGTPLPAGMTTADFIKAVTPFDHGAVPLPGVPDPTIGPASFENVIPDTDVIFEVRAFNDLVEPTASPRLFVANIEVLADDCGELDARDVFILVPPAKLPPPG